jgi:transposase
MNLRYRVELSQAERDELKTLIGAGKHPARKLKRAQISLAAAAGASDEDIAISVGVGGSTVYRTKRRFVLGNLEAALSEEARPGASRKLSGREEALLVATACSGPPAGRARWTLELLAGELVRLTEHLSISRERCVGDWRKTSSSRGARTCGAFHKWTANTLRAWRMSSTFMPKPPIRSARWSALMKAPPNLLVRCASRSRPSQASAGATTTNTSAMEPSIYSSSLTRTVPGAKSKSLTACGGTSTPFHGPRRRAAQRSAAAAATATAGSPAVGLQSARRAIAAQACAKSGTTPDPAAAIPRCAMIRHIIMSTG